MLTFFRRGIIAKLMLILLGLVLFAIVITGFGAGGIGLDALRNLGGGGLATIEGQRVTPEEVTVAATRQLDQARREQPEADMASLVRQGLVDQIVDQLVTINGTMVFGRRQGLAATRDMVDREIANFPQFQNIAGKFDDNAFRRALAEQKMSESQFREEIARTLIQRQLILPALGSAIVPQGVAFRYASLLLESRTGSLGAVPVAAMGGGAPPSDSEIASAYQARIARYTIPERRVIRYALFDSARVAAQAKASEAEIQALYKQNSAQYAARETRNLQQVVLQTEAAAKGFAQKLAAGTSFEQAAQQAGFAAGDIAIGDQTREGFARISSPAVAAAAFSAAKGAATAPVKSVLGWHIVRTVDIKTIPGKSIDSVRAELATQIEQKKSQEALADLAGRIEDKVSGGASFDETVRANALTVTETPPVTASGAAPDSPTWTAPPELKAMLESAFAMAPEDAPTVATIVPNQRFALVALGRVVPPAAPPLAQIRDRVRADLVAERGLARARAVATAIVAKINAGTAPAQAFAEAKLNLPALQTITATRHDIASQQNKVPPPLAMLFAIPRGKARLMPAPNGQGWLIVALDRIVPGDASKQPQVTDAVRNQFASILGDEYAAQFSNAILAGEKVKRNEKAIADLKARLANGSAQ